MDQTNQNIADDEGNNEDERKLSPINTHPSANRNPKKRKVNVENAMEVETSHTDGSDSFVYLVIDGRMSQPIEVKVVTGDNLNKIKDRLKIQTRPYFDSIPTFEIELFESDEHKKPLKSVVTWNSKVEWGTQTQPLIVKVNPSMVTVAPVNTGNSVAIFGKCLFCCVFE